MMASARIAFTAFAAAGFFTILWWSFGHFFDFFGIRGAADVPLWLATIAGVIFGATIGAIGHAVDRRRAERNRAAAEESGYAFVENVADAVFDELPNVSLFQKDSRGARFRMTGTRGEHAFDVFDFDYTVTSSSGDGHSSSTYSQTVFRFPNAGSGLPRFLIQPRCLFTSFLSHLIGATEVDLSPPATADAELAEAFEQFREKYQLTVAEPDAAPSDLERVFHPFAVAWLSQSLGLLIESNGVDLVVWKANTRCVGSDRLVSLDYLNELLELTQAADVASLRMPTAHAVFRRNDQTNELGGYIGLAFGAMFGLTFGGALSTLFYSTIVPQFNAKLMKDPLVAFSFVATILCIAALGGYIGRRVGRKWLFRAFAALRKNQRTAVDESDRTSAET